MKKQRNILIIGGWSSRKIYFEKLISHLEKENNIFYIDFNNTNKDFDKKLIKFVQDNSLDNFEIIAWSMGGLVTLSSYETLKDKIHSITFISSMAKFCKSPDYKIGWNKRIISLMIDKLKINADVVLQDFNKRLVYNKDIFLFENININNSTINNLSFGLEYLIESDFRDKLYTIKSKVLIIHGENDTIAPIDHANFMFNNLTTNKKIIKLKDCAHMPFISHTQTCYNSLINLWKGDF
ncbi:MAG: serine aminopeptidase domain-containing protein [Sarcina sp.]